MRAAPRRPSTPIASLTRVRTTITGREVRLRGDDGADTARVARGDALDGVDAPRTTSQTVM